MSFYAGNQFEVDPFQAGFEQGPEAKARHRYFKVGEGERNMADALIAIGIHPVEIEAINATDTVLPPQAQATDTVIDLNDYRAAKNALESNNLEHLNYVEEITQRYDRSA